MDWYGMEMKFREWMNKPMSTTTTLVASALTVAVFMTMIYLSM